MVTNDYALLQAASLRVSWADKNMADFFSQVSNVTGIEEARDLILALTMTADVPADAMRKMLSTGF